MATSSVARVLTLILVLSTVCNVHSLQSNYYKDSCPGAEATVAKVVAKAIRKDTRVGAGLLRMFFHDCFVEGCDGSVLIDSPSGDAEKDSVPDQTLHSFDVIDDAKAAVEDICAQTVSCADVLAFAAATSVVVLGGPLLDIQGGRFDGLVSSSDDTRSNIPAPNDTLSTLQSLFNSKGLNNQDLVVLAGAHTIGKARCQVFSGRLYPKVDSSLNAEFADSLKTQCPVNTSSSTIVDIDVQTPTCFDNAYHQNVQNGKGVLQTDAQLYTTSQTSDFVDQYAASNDDFLQDFANSLIKMGKIGVKTGSNGNIRTKCTAFH